jgi:hypothetical protein
MGFGEIRQIWWHDVSMHVDSKWAIAGASLSADVLTMLPSSTATAVPINRHRKSLATEMVYRLDLKK